MRIVVAGWTVGFPVAGFFWHPVSYAIGFRQLGHEVWYLDESGSSTAGWDVERECEDPGFAYGVSWMAREMAAVGLAGRWVFRDLSTGRHHGLDARSTDEVLATAEVLIDVSLTLPLRSEYRRIPHRLGIDTDPVFTQIRLARNPAMREAVLDGHTRLFSFGRTPLPGHRHDWVPTRQPVPTAHWPVASSPPADAPFTTISAWQAYPAEEWQDQRYGAKDASFRQLLDLPARTTAPLEVALGGGDSLDEGARLLGAHGWRTVSATEATRSSASYRAYIGASAAELGVAKHGYVAARSGWFSERTCCYLASGRAAVVQDTGWTDWLPSGSGLLAYRSIDEAAAAIEVVRADPAGHGAAARRLVEEHFEAAAVCAELLAAGI